MMIWLALILFITILIDSWVFYYWMAVSRHQQLVPLKDENLPFISILIAARNEEQNIARCLQSLVEQEYPTHLVEILVGDDSSNDATSVVVKTFQTLYPQINYYLIPEQSGHQKAKANVLLQLAQKAKGEYYFITDADMELPSTWVKGLLSAMKPNTGIVTGFTAIASEYNFAKLQDIDWTFALGLIKVISDKFKPVTSMGNNMVVSKEAYQAVGGYEKIPFSITEDYELFKQVLRKGYQPINLIDREVEGISKPQPNWSFLLKQRRRWLKGAFGLNSYMWMMLSFQASFFPVLIILSIFYPLIGLLFLSLKITFQSLFIRQILKKLNRSYSSFNYIQYEVYSMISTLSLLVYSTFTKIEWKGRKF